MSKRVMVTGGAGFIGSHVVDELIKEGHDVIVIDDLSGGLESNINPKAKFIRGSICDKKTVEEAMNGVNIVYHLAAYAAEGLSHFIRRYNYMNNLIGSVNLINAAIKNKVECFLFTSSMAVYGFGNPPFSEKDAPKPEDPYGIAKFSVEQDLKIAHEMFGLNYIIIRPHNVYGERQFLGDPYRNVIGIFMNRIMNDKPILVYGDGEQTRAFSYIRDVAHCIAKAPFSPKARNEIINLGSAKVYTINELSQEVMKAMNANVSIIHTAPRYEVKHAYCTTEKSELFLDYKDKTSLGEGLSNMAKWAKKTGPMKPIVWEGYELENNLPEFWKTLKNDFPESKNRINPEKF